MNYEWMNAGFKNGGGTLPDNLETKTQDGSAEFNWVTDTIYTGAKAISIVHTNSAAAGE